VRVDQLRAHLEVYVDTIPEITALRLCNRFGTGDNCHINKLPIELVGLIEEHIVGPEREDALVTCSRMLKHCEGSCEPFDHYYEEELYHLYHSTYGCLNKGCEMGHPRDWFECYHDECEGEECPAWRLTHASDLKVRKQLDELSDVQYIHHNDLRERCNIYREDFEASFDEDGAFFKENRELLNNHFGLSIWTGKIRPLSMSEEHTTTTAYLTLPNNTTRHEKWQRELFMKAENIGYGMPVNVGAPPTEHSLSRFPRALKILGLQAWTHPSLEGRPILSPPSVATLESKTTDKAAMQPQLTFLVRNNIERQW